ncbi:hypothetical protein NX821_000675 [Clostridium septicum]|uniref:5'-nucleotidase, lipoprotein e(P4) family n=1 Tax=Clostridium septicum TaxID=1504 RepID=UPI003217C673
MLKKYGNVFKFLFATFLIISISAFGIGCRTKLSYEKEKIIGTEDSITNDWRKESYINGILYQLSAEVKGLQYQSYKLATVQLDKRIAERESGMYKKPLAIISDIDDTLASDCNYIAGIILQDEKWDNGPWNGYYDSIASTSNVAIPGAVEFMNYASKNGIEIFYVTNREHTQLNLSVAQLQHLGFPNADKEHVKVCDESGSSDKTERRENILKDYDVVMYLGDNIGDFTEDFSKELGTINRNELASDPKYKDLWGNKYILLPNSTYGNYVESVWNNKKGLTEDEKVQAIKEILDNYSYKNTDKFEQWYKSIN